MVYVEKSVHKSTNIKENQSRHIGKEVSTASVKAWGMFETLSTNKIMAYPLISKIQNSYFIVYVKKHIHISTH